MSKKPFWASKTLWVNAIALVASIAGVFGLDLGLDAEAQTSLVAGIMAAVNIILRLTTDQGVRMRCAPVAVCLALALVLTACAGSAETRATNALAIACDGYATTLAQLTPLRADGTLTPDQVARVNSTNALVDPLCASESTIDPAAAVAKVRASVVLLTTIRELYR